MKSFKFCLTFVLIFILSSCTQSQKRKIALESCNVEYYNDKIEIIPSPKEDKKLPDGLSYGIYKNRECNGSKAEDNLIRQYTTYVNSLFFGDEKACRKYVFKDAVKYHKKMFPSASEEEIWQRYFEEMSTVRQLNDITSTIGMETEAVVPRMIVKISSGEEIYIKFQSSMKLYTNKYYYHIDKLEDCLAYSNTSGKKWEFITINEDTEGILSLNCNKDVIHLLVNGTP